MKGKRRGEDGSGRRKEGRWKGWARQKGTAEREREGRCGASPGVSGRQARGGREGAWAVLTAGGRAVRAVKFRPGKLCPDRAVSSADSIALSWAVSTMVGARPPARARQGLLHEGQLVLVLRFMSSHLCLMSLTELNLADGGFSCSHAFPNLVPGSAWDSRMGLLPKRTACRVTSVTRMSSSSLGELGLPLRSSGAPRSLG